MSEDYKCPECGNSLDVNHDDGFYCGYCRESFSPRYVIGYWRGYNDAKKAAQQSAQADATPPMSTKNDSQTAQRR